ncbi:hypothetical protein NHQ30_010325 [Ciborinia camelliae]|nr:hypothetical protein NHQ30_010325 [Ciborinia camelliae]
MDGIGAASGVLGLLDVSFKITTGILEYSKQVKNYSKDIKDLRTEIKTLRRILVQAKKGVNDSNYPIEDWPLATKSSFDHYQNLLNDVEAKIKKRTNRFSFPLFKTGFQTDIETVQRFRGMINTEILMKVATQGVSDKIYEWLSPLDPSQRHNDLRRRRHEKTGDWFVEEDDFKDWKISQPASLLWIHGIPGCGKSVLASRIIDALAAHCKGREAEGLGLAYFYFDFSIEEQQKKTKMIRSVIWQLAVRSPAARQVMTTKLWGFLLQKIQPGDDDLLACLDQMLKEFKESFIIIDALDECNREDQDVLKAVQRIAVRQRTLRTLVTSRKEPKIEKMMEKFKLGKKFISLEGIGVDNDIRKYIRYKIQNDSDFERWHEDVDFQMQVEEKLVEKANGMFRWVECQLVTLREFYETDQNGEDLRELLNSLPKTLDETYKRILQSVSKNSLQKTLTLLRWLCFSGRPLAIREVAEAFAIDVDKSRFNSSARFRMPSEVLKLCPGMIVTIVPTGINSRNLDKVMDDDEIKLAHFSVKEYLQSDGIREGKMSSFYVEEKLTNLYLARACLSYMTHIDPDNITSEILTEYPLATYSAQYWPIHTRIALSHGSSDQQLVRNIDQLLASNTKLLTWVKLFDPDTGKPRYDAVMSDILSPLYYASICGLSHKVETLITGGADIEVQGGILRRPLAAACRHGFALSVKLLLDAGANFTIGSHDSSAMYDAALSGNIKVVQLLLAKEKAAADNKEENMSWPICHIDAVSAACGRGYKDIVDELLVKNDGTDINNDVSLLERTRWVLQQAAANGSNHIVHQLLDLGAKLDIEGGWYGTALRAAAVNGHEPVVRTLMEKGADPHLHGNSPGSAFVSAICLDRSSIFDFLLQNGRVNINNNEGMYGSPLQAASMCGNLKFVLNLLEKGADVNAEGGLHHTALQAASTRGYEEVVEVLLNHGARANDSENDLGDVIWLTPSDGSDVIILVSFNMAGLKPHEWNGIMFVRMNKDVSNEQFSRVIRDGPSIAIQKGVCGSALRAAAINGHLSIVQRLLRAKAKVDARGGAMWSVLESASSSEIKQLLQDATSLAQNESRSYTKHKMIDVEEIVFQDEAGKKKGPNQIHDLYISIISYGGYQPLRAKLSLDFSKGV